MIGYCVSCGKSRKLSGGLCPRCAADFAKAEKRIALYSEQPLTREWIAENARRYRTLVASAFLKAVDG